MRIAFVVFCALLMLGCARTPKMAPLPTQPSKPVVTPDFRANGRVEAVNSEARFIIVHFPLTSVAPVGSQLGIFRDGLKVGVAKVTGPEQNGNTVADLVNGEAKVNDEARQE